MHVGNCPDCRNERELAAAKAETAAMQTQLDAWHSVFGTSQLSHAQAAREQAEKDVERLTKERDVLLACIGTPEKIERELWHEGKVVAHATASLIMTKDIPDSLRSQYDFLNEPFGRYPDVPRQATATKETT
jgi:hypothetical protein